MDEDQNNGETLEFEEEVVEEEGLKDKLKKLRKDLEACRKEKEEYLAGWQRAKADRINARKDEEKSREAFVKFAEERLLQELFPLADSLEHAIKTEGSEGFENIYLQLKALFASHGILPIESEGKKFNPAEHEALAREETKEREQDDIVLEELGRGYIMHGKVLRPARVKVGYYKE